MAVKNVICLSVDRLQAGMLGPYGNAWIRTPEVDRLAAQSIVFDQAFACEPTPAAVLAALWPEEILHPLSSTLITDDPFVEAHPLAKSFVDKLLLEMPSETSAVAKEIEATQFAAFFSKATQSVAEAREPFCLWLHTRGMAGPWDAPLKFRNQYAEEEDPEPPTFTNPPNRLLPSNYDPDDLLGITQAYAGQVSLFDTCLGVLLDALDESPAANETMFVLLGIRGFPLGEHRRVGECDAALYNELTHIPCIVRLPDGTGSLTRRQSLITHGDVPAMISAWLSNANREPSTAHRILSILSEASDITWRDHLILRSHHERAIRTSAWYLRESSSGESVKRELYIKPDDRWEVNDIADRCRDIAIQLTGVLATPQDGVLGPLPEALVTAVD